MAGSGGPGRGCMLRFRVLAPLEVWTGQDWSGIGAPKWRALLAVLLLSQGQAVSTDRLIAELWGDRPPERAANLVSIYVLRLRRVIGDRAGHLLTTRAPGYQLRLQPGELDAEQFHALAGQGRKVLAEGDFRRAVRAGDRRSGTARGIPAEHARIAHRSGSGLRHARAAGAGTAQAALRPAAPRGAVGAADPGAGRRREARG